MAANTLGSMPSFAASVMPSEVAIISMASIMLLQIFATCPLPIPPQWTMFLPMACSTALVNSKSFASPPTMKVSVPASAPATPPDTGASTMGQPFAFASIATSRAVSGSMVEESMSGVPGAAPFNTPYSPRYTERTWGEEGSIVITSSTPRAHSAAEVATSQPSFSSLFTSSEATSCTLSLCPCFRRLRAMGLPMCPKPMNPIFILLLLFLARRDREHGRGLRGAGLGEREHEHQECEHALGQGVPVVDPEPAVAIAHRDEGIGRFLGGFAHAKEGRIYRVRACRRDAPF